MAEQPGRVTGLRTGAVPVTDQERARRFYGDVLGLDVRLDAPMEQLGGRWIEVGAEGGTSIALIPADEGYRGRDTGIRLVSTDAAALHGQLSGDGFTVG